MSDEKMPVSISSSTLSIMGVELIVHVLDNGQRIIEADGLNKFFEMMADGFEMTPDDTMKIAKAVRG